MQTGNIQISLLLLPRYHQIITTASKKNAKFAPSNAEVEQKSNCYVFLHPGFSHLRLFLGQDLPFALTTSSDHETCSNLPI